MLNQKTGLIRDMRYHYAEVLLTEATAALRDYSLRHYSPKYYVTEVLLH